MRLTRGQLTAFRRYADRLDRVAATEKAAYNQLRARFPEYGAPSMVMTAAEASDNAARVARLFRDRLTQTEREC